MTSDALLLCRFVKERDQSAFAELVQRHFALVYAAALRRVNGRADLAEEISQKVFSDLARRSAGLVQHPTLVGWLHRSTRYAAIDAVRSEARRQKLAESLAALSFPMLSSEPRADWEQLRPVIDDAIDQLRESDRQLVLLRFLKGASFAEAGEILNLSENTARMRFQRALERLRAHLGRRGVTSTTAALALIAADPAWGASPLGLAGAVAAKAGTALSVGSTVGASSLIFMSKISPLVVTAAVAGGLTALVWTARIHGIGQKNLAALRSENARLQAATAPSADPALATAVAQDFSARAAAIARAVVPAVSGQTGTADASHLTLTGRAKAAAGRGFRNFGQASPLDASQTMAWAAVAGDISALANDIWFDPDVRGKAVEILASMPEAVRTQFPTAEQFYAFLVSADALVAPPPGPDVQAALVTVTLRPGRAETRWPGSEHSAGEFQLTPGGWKYVIPLVGVENMPANLSDDGPLLAAAQATTP